MVKINLFFHGQPKGFFGTFEMKYICHFKISQEFAF